MKLLKAIFGLARPTLSDQVREHCTRNGWDDTAANTAAATAVEICGNDDTCSPADLRDVLCEVCRQG